MDFLNKFANKRKLKYGAVLAGFLAMVIAIILVLNVLVSILADRYNWYFDMTDEQLYSASDTFIDAMERVEDVNLEIVFLSDEDVIKNNYSINDLNTGLTYPGLAYVNTTATQLASRLPNVTVSYHSTNDIPFMRQFDMSTNAGVELDETYVIVMRTTAPGVLDGNQFVPFHYKDFSLVAESSYSLFAYNGEAKIIEAAIKLTQEKSPIAYYLTNHNCKKTDTFGKLFENAGFEYEGINLEEKIYTCECGEIYTQSFLEAWNLKNNPNYIPEEGEVDIDEETGEIVFVRNFKCDNTKCDGSARNIFEKEMKLREKIPDNTRALVIFEPTTDFTKEEIILIEDYLGLKGTVMVFLDSDVDKENMPNLYEFLEVFGGITINTNGNGYITDGVYGTNNSSTQFKVNVPQNAATNAFFPEFSSSSDSFVVTNTVSLTVNEVLGEGDNTTLDVMPLLQTSQYASFNGETLRDGHTLMTISKHGVLVENPNATTIAQQDFSSCLLVSANGSFVNDSHLVSTTNSNAKFIRTLIAATTSDQIYATDVEFKVFNNYDLSITNNQQIIVLVLSMTVLPIIIGVVGFVVIYRRKRR